MDNKIRSSSISLMISSCNKCFFLGIYLSYIINVAKDQTIWALLLGILFSIIPFALLIHLFNLDSDKSIIGKIKNNFSKPFYYVLSHILVLIILLIGIFLLWEVNSFIANEFLSEHPTLAILVILCFPIMYLTLNNFQVLTRFNTICIAIAFVIALTNIFSLSPKFELANIGFDVTSKIPDLIKCALYYTVLSIGPCFMLLIHPKDKISDSKKFKKTMWYTYIYSIIISIGIFLAVLLSMDANLLAKYTYPEFIVLKMINLFKFLDTIENVSALMWFNYMTVSISLCTIFIKNSIKEVYNVSSKKKDKIISIIIVLTLFLSCFPFINYSYYLNIINIHIYPFIICLSLLIICLLIIVKIHIKNKKSV